ncbi:MAG: Ig-like domain-containing protein [Ruminococcus sp.]
MKKGKSYTLKPKLSYTEKADKVTYKSSNKKIATVSEKGVIKGKKKGTATITIKSGKINQEVQSKS